MLATDVASSDLRGDPLQLIYTQPTCPKTVQNLFDAWAATYESYSTSNLEYAGAKECAKVAAMFAKDGGSLLDVGAGTGLVARCLRENHKAPSFSYSMGCDLSAKMLDFALNDKLYDDVEQMDIGRLPWQIPSEKFDLVTCAGVLIFVDEVKCLKEFVRVTKTGGHIVLMFRHDGYVPYSAMVEELASTGVWKLVHKSEDHQNMSRGTDLGRAASNMFNILAFQKL